MLARVHDGFAEIRAYRDGRLAGRPFDRIAQFAGITRPIVPSNRLSASSEMPSAEWALNILLSPTLH